MKDDPLFLYSDRPDVNTAIIGDIPLISFACTQCYDVMSQDKRIVVESNLDTLGEHGAKQLENVFVDDIRDLKPEQLENTTSVFFVPFKSSNGMMAVCRLDMDDNLSRFYKNLEDSPVLDEEDYSEQQDDYLEDNKYEIIGDIIHKVFDDDSELEEKFDAEIQADSRQAVEEVWGEIKECMGIESSGWFFDDEERAVELAREAMLLHIENIETMHSDMSM